MFQNINSKAVDMDLEEEKNKLLYATSTLKNDAKAIQSKIQTHSLLIEAIDASNTENTRIIQESSRKLTDTISKIKKDPRNKIITLLVLIVVVLSVYLLKF